MGVSSAKLRPGDEVRIIAPARSHSIIASETREYALRRLSELNLLPSFGAHVESSDAFLSSPIEERVADLHEAFRSSSIRAILSVIGGFNTINIIDHIDYSVIEANPKIICGYSDVTVLVNAIHARTGLITYYGPHYSTFGMLVGGEYTDEYFRKALFSDEEFSVQPSLEWSDDTWFLDQKNRTFRPNPGPVVIQEGEAEGQLVGGNINAFRLLNGTPYAPALAGRILFLENDGLDKELTDKEFDRRLDSILLQRGGDRITALLIGRFKEVSKMSLDTLRRIIEAKRALRGVPVVYGHDFGHSNPMLTLPIGGTARLIARAGDITLDIILH